MTRDKLAKDILQIMENNEHSDCGYDGVDEYPTTKFEKEVCTKDIVDYLIDNFNIKLDGV